MAAWRTAMVVALLSTLGVVSAATLADRRAKPRAVTVPVPPADPLAGRGLIIPVKGVTREKLRDNFLDRRGRRIHNALDIMAARGTPVVAAGDGTVAKAYRHPLGGLCVYQYDEDGEYVYLYAHLDSFAPGLAAGAPLRRGDLVGYVGSTGNAPERAPHLHFAMAKLGPEKKWYRGTPVNPYPYLLEGSR